MYGVGSVAGGQPVLIEQQPGSRSATVLDPSAVDPAATSTNKASVVALGLDVWLLGEGEPHNGWHHPWFTYDDRDFGAARRRFSQVADRASTGDLRSDRPCWSREIDSESLPRLLAVWPVHVSLQAGHTIAAA